MRNLKKTFLCLALFAAAAAPLSAQVWVTQMPRGWLGISYLPAAVQRNGARSSAITITEVSKGSPAERAGVQVGDTLVRLNDFRATSDLLESMGASVEPGDTVHSTVRRGGHDKTLAIEVAKRPADTYALGNGARIYTYDPDSVRGMMKLFVDSMYAGLDTSKMRTFRFDTTIVRGFGNDSALFSSKVPFSVFQYRMNGDSMRRMLPGQIFPDSAFFRGQNGVFMDSMFRVLPRMNDDMLRDLPAGGMLPPGVFEKMRTPDLVFRNFARGESAFAGADLTNVNADLGEYFGTRTGALVLDVPDGTPAARAGLEAGDIITKVDGIAVSNVAQLRDAVAKAKRGANIKLEVMRHQKTHALELKRE